MYKKVDFFSNHENLQIPLAYIFKNKNFTHITTMISQAQVIKYKSEYVLLNL